MPNRFEQLTEYFTKADVLHASKRFELVSPDVAETANLNTAFIRERYPDRRGARIVVYLDGSSAVSR